MKHIEVIHGPNLNLLGQREPDIYGAATLDDLDTRLHERAQALGFSLRCRQSNLEGELVTWLQQARGEASGIVLNPAGYTHTSVAIRDAVLACGVPTVEVHLSDPLAREGFRHQSVLAGAVVGRIAGLGPLSYLLALEAFGAILASR